MYTYTLHTSSESSQLNKPHVSWLVRDKCIHWSGQHDKRLHLEVKVIHPKYYKSEKRCSPKPFQVSSDFFFTQKTFKVKMITHDISHDLTFSAHTINCVCHSIRSIFRALGMYNFGLMLENEKVFKCAWCIWSSITQRSLISIRPS